MNKDLTDISVVLDRSGSMDSIKGDTIGGFNTFLKDQKAAPGSANLTLAQFDDEYEIVYEGKNIQEAPELTADTFVPRGWTALWDAIGRTVNSAGARLSALPEDQRPGKIIFVILTDGHENRSKEFTQERIKEMIEHQRTKYAWDFVFLGANQDAVLVGGSMGISPGFALNYCATSDGTRNVFHTMSSSMKSYRACSDASQIMNFFPPPNFTNQPPTN